MTESLTPLSKEARPRSSEPGNANAESHGVRGLPFDFVALRPVSCDTPRPCEGGWHSHLTGQAKRLFALDEQQFSELKGLALQGREIAERLKEFSRG
jgi:hypothetical protein